jgi:hypothetical protein
VELEIFSSVWHSARSVGGHDGRNKPTGDNTRKGAVRKRSQLPTKMAGEERWTKRSRASGRFMDVKQDERKFKGVRRERPAARRDGN